MEYKKHIVSTKENQTFLHRTDKDLVDIIMQEGLGCGPGGDILGTATWQPNELEKAENSYQRTHKGSDAVVIVNIPSSKINRRNRSSIAMTKGLGYFHQKRSEFAIRPEFVTGWIDKTNNEYHPNPHKNRVPPAGHERYESVLED
ncbi:MAG: hypothetical protein Q7R87_00975 [Nanoarchaeota archaeon]|nr:hypothetical protein [Nanoarchaeota archaeon]